MLYTYRNPYRVSKRYRISVQLHAHTTNSDGDTTPAAVMTSYKNASYSAAALTDHALVTPNPGVAGITHISGYEDASIGSHLVCLYATAVANATTYQGIIDQITAQGGFCVAAHPTYGSIGWSNQVLAALNNLRFIEVYNGVVNLQAETTWDYLLTNSPFNLHYAVAVDDLHVLARDFDQAWVNVLVDSVSEIKDSLWSGNFYSTTGPAILPSMDDDGLISAYADSDGTMYFIGKSGTIMDEVAVLAGVTATYQVQSTDTYIRVKFVRTSNGTMAWSNPFDGFTFAEQYVPVDISRLVPKYARKYLRRKWWRNR